MDYGRLGVDVAIRCERCRYSRTITFEQMEAVFGLAARVAAVRRRLVCSKCGSRGAKLAPVPRFKGECPLRPGEAALIFAREQPIRSIRRGD
jgi:hypothetical protein